MYHIEVTQQDIDYGIRGSYDRCPVARAVQRATGDDMAEVGSWNIIVFGNVYALSPLVGDWITAYDLGATLADAFMTKPFSFDLDLGAKNNEI